MSLGLNLRIAYETVKENLKTTFVLSLIFMGMAAMYAGFYPSFKGNLEELMKNFPEMGFIRGFESFASYPGFLNAELYQIFWILILAIIFGYISASLISKEIEGKTMDMLLSNPIHRYRIVLEKFLGLLPLILVVNFATMASVYGITLAIGEELEFFNLLTTHIFSIPYFLAITSLGIFVSTIINKKMKASMVVMAVVIGSYIFESVSLLAPDYEKLGLISLTHYFNPAETLVEGSIDIIGTITLIAVTVVFLLMAMVYFERRDIEI
ncbi:hypothetical protein AKJ40_00205 [candidate division MSBL1 archaeon SCGC-AAA259M10]|uniref:ABC transporter permease n=4 Tax=candidate division MSBL1 TaxID=215777 RepID=A0A656YWV7_9EURY|nr:hypothetical protein AKJ66_00265 [candidate division MSBL1 archaeon SCGC-AAA259E22]KXA95433.1 hypothetical protein AKJ36_00605 [candidate division MSBL1 archaeon SCGC-AAA259I07]KXA98695.1 hypothetical protein AKJ39_01120 [candidate division MSBL1 archaeon SCGC-AAA259J03]KXB00892.1 hypothetical protein AKJ40_00205 [candidate division MSBL1 archaeon SCGC-AAA259M10]